MTSGEMIKIKNEFFSLDEFFVFIYSSAISERGVVTSSESTTGFFEKVWFCGFNFEETRPFACYSFFRNSRQEVFFLFKSIF